MKFPTSFALPFVFMMVAACCQEEPAPDERGVERPASEHDGDGASPIDFAKSPFHAEGPVAKVDGTEISAEAFNNEVLLLTSRVPALPAGQAERYKFMVLDRVVDDHLVGRAATSENIEVTGDDVQLEFDKVKKRVESQSSGGMAAFYQQYGIDEVMFRSELARSLRIKKLVMKEAPVEIAEEEARSFYDRNTFQFRQSEQVRASHILLEVEATADGEAANAVEKRATDLVNQAREDGADFAELARNHSQGPSGPQGGDLGFFEKSQMVAPFAQAAWALEPGEVSDPVRTRFGWHVIKVFERKDKATRTFEEVKAEICERLVDERLATATQEKLALLRAEASIETLLGNIKDNPDAPTQAPPGHGHSHGPGGEHR